MCTDVCAVGKYYDPGHRMCKYCDLLKPECWPCGPSKNACLHDKSCRAGYEWDETTPNTCRLKLTPELLRRMGLNPLKKYFKPEKEDKWTDVDIKKVPVLGRKASIRLDDTRAFPTETKMLFTDQTKISFESDTTLSWYDKISKH